MLNNRWMPSFARLWLCVFSAALTVAGNSMAASSSSPFIVDSLNNEQGLPQSSVISVIQTKDGYLWLGTLNGLVRFDGNIFTLFNQHKQPGLSSDRIVYLFEDSRTNLWVGTESSGVAMVNGGDIKNFAVPSEAGGGKLISAYEDSAGTVWFYTADDHFFCYQEGRMDFHPSTFPQELLYRARNMLAPIRIGGFWLIQNGRIRKWLGKKNEIDFGIGPWGNSKVTATAEDNDGNLIVGTQGAGVFWYEPDGKHWQISTNENLSSPFVLSLCMDRGGNLWVGTDGGGLNRIKRKNFSTPAALRPPDRPIRFRR